MSEADEVARGESANLVVVAEQAKAAVACRRTRRNAPNCDQRDALEFLQIFVFLHRRVDDYSRELPGGKLEAKIFGFPFLNHQQRPWFCAMVEAKDPVENFSIGFR